MKFEEALASMRQGKRVKRKHFNFAWSMVGNCIRFVAGPNVGAAPSLFVHDLLADDWVEEVPPAPKLYPFSVALEMARQDESVRIKRHSPEWGGPVRYAFLNGIFGGYGRDGDFIPNGSLSTACLQARDWVIEGA